MRQVAPTKAARFSSSLCGFGKFDVPANAKGAPFAFSVNVSAFDGYEPAVGDYVVYSGEYSVNLALDAASPPIASWLLVVNGTYTWTWDFTQ